LATGFFTMIVLSKRFLNKSLTRSGAAPRLGGKGVFEMNANAKRQIAPTSVHSDRVPRPVTPRPPANPRSFEEMLADAKRRHAEALAYLATR
jgi:hypothetical protein